MKTSHDHLESLTTRWAWIVAFLVMLALPLGYFTLAYRLHDELLQQLTRIKAEQIAALASENPELWMYQTPRIEDLLLRHKGSTEANRQTVLDAREQILVQVGQPLQAPIHSHSQPIFESGRIVGRIEIAHSMREELQGTLLAGLLGLLLGGAVYFTLRILPLRALRRVTQALLGQQQRFVTAVESAMDGYALLDAQGKLLEVNESLCAITGYSRGELLALTIADLEAAPNAGEFIARVNTIRHGRLETRWKRRDGAPIDVEVTATCLAQANTEFFCFFRDITQKKASEALIWKQANFDMLTQLPNRSMLHYRLAEEIKKARREQLQLALLFVDLDRFKEVNDTLGHDIGDLLLVEAAQRICACVRETDTVARLGGDEFTVILAGIEKDKPDTVERIAREIIEQISSPFKLMKEQVQVSASIGITFYPADASTIEGLFKNADKAMYAAKNQGRNRHCYFTPTPQDSLFR
ncbi:MAG: sensor domain-containing diguanylate cyclase [Sterolibacterium sp.]|nr:sensor domain-containing diguanylate cyclase [Sterolibacterium sp.]